jgi:undecaprenyl-diphosphatase
MIVSGARRPSLWWLVGCAAAAFILLALLVVRRFDPMLDFDSRVSQAARSVTLAHPLWHAVMAGITTTGGTAIIGPLAALACVILLVWRRWRQAVFVAVAMIATTTARLAVVTLIARPRPTERLAVVASYSFPSGHSTASAAAALVLVWVCWPLLRRRWSRLLLCGIAGAWAFAVGLSRVALVVHWPTDVVGAWLFVLVVVPACGILIDRLFGRREVPATATATATATEDPPARSGDNPD